ncbi:MAG TPA: hypothetical protein VGF92_19155 [Stellaceae bacterium]|jgi:hypothetical protein
MISLAKSLLLLAVGFCAVASAARADDYVGKTEVQAGGVNATACVSQPMKVTIADSRVALGTGGAPAATAPLESDGTFKTNYTRSLGTNGVFSVQINVSGRLQDGKVVGTTSTSGGCVQNFTLTKQ